MQTNPLSNKTWNCMNCHTIQCTCGSTVVVEAARSEERYNMIRKSIRAIEREISCHPGLHNPGRQDFLVSRKKYVFMT